MPDLRIGLGSPAVICHCGGAVLCDAGAQAVVDQAHGCDRMWVQHTADTCSTRAPEGAVYRDSLGRAATEDERQDFAAIVGRVTGSTPPPGRALWPFRGTRPGWLEAPLASQAWRQHYQRLLAPGVVVDEAATLGELYRATLERRPEGWEQVMEGPPQRIRWAGNLAATAPGAASTWLEQLTVTPTTPPPAPRQRSPGMTQSDIRCIAETLKAGKPDPAGATVGERMLWARLVDRMCVALRARRGRGWTDEQFYQWAGQTPMPPPRDEDEEGSDDEP